MIAFNNFNLLASFLRKLLVLFRQGITTKQRISAPFWMYPPGIPPRNPKFQRPRSKDALKLRAWAFLFLDYHQCPFIDEIEKLDHIGVTQPDATVAIPLAYFVLVFGAMNVDETFACVSIVGIDAVQPENARHDQILCRRRRSVGVQWNASTKNCAARHAVPDLLRHAKIAGRRFEASFFCPDAKARSRDRVTSDRSFAFQQSKLLIANGNVYASARLHGI